MLRITCPTCTTRNAPGSFVCTQCFASIAHADLSEDDVPVPEPVANLTSPDSGARVVNRGPEDVPSFAPVAPPLQPVTEWATQQSGRAVCDPVSCSQCNHRQIPDATSLCLRCGAPLPATVGPMLVPSTQYEWYVGWPWGEETVLDRPLALGRDASPPWLRKRLEQHRMDGLSRQHAVLTPMAEKLTLTDLGSSNGSFVNGLRAQSRVPVDVPPQSELGFSAALKISVMRRSRR